MKFTIDNKELSVVIGLAMQVAIKHSIEDHDYEGLITINANKRKLQIDAFAGRSSITTTIPKDGTAGYDCKRAGIVTVYAVDMFKGLTTMDDGEVEIKSLQRAIVITSLSNTSVIRELAMISSRVCPPNVGTTFDQSIVVNKTIYTEGLKTVMFAPAVEEKMFTYMCVLFEAWPEKQVVRFTAGTGGRFVIKSVKGNNICKADEDVKILFPKTTLSCISNILSSVSCNTIVINTVLEDTRKNIPEQIMLTFNAGDIEIVLCVFGSMGEFPKYPHMTKIIEHKYSNRIYSKLRDWDSAVGGAVMTQRGHDSKIHNTEVVFDLDEERFMVTPKAAHPCTTPSKAVNVEGDANTVKGDKIWFRCNTTYLKEMIKLFKKDGVIQLNFDSQETLNDIPEDKPKQLRPVLIKFPETINTSRNTTERIYMFFTVSTKE